MSLSNSFQASITGGNGNPSETLAKRGGPILDTGFSLRTSGRPSSLRMSFRMCMNFIVPSTNVVVTLLDRVDQIDSLMELKVIQLAELY